eukprot:6209174-Pleurochrysis_carterae.AAC.2
MSASGLQSTVTHFKCCAQVCMHDLIMVDTGQASEGMGERRSRRRRSCHRSAAAPHRNSVKIESARSRTARRRGRGQRLTGVTLLIKARDLWMLNA